jgi:pimeloyl-ACP methyl ester carboxylesterase
MPTTSGDNGRPRPAIVDALARPFHAVGNVDTLSVDGVALRYWRYGDGPRTVVLIHGNSACKEVFASQFAAFADLGLTLYAFDLPGHGASSDSPSPQQHYTIPGYARLLRRAFETLSITRPLVVGWSLGGHIALEMAGGGLLLAGILITGTPPIGPGADDFTAAFTAMSAAGVTTRAEASDADIRAYVKNLYGTLDPIPDLFFSAARRTDGQARAIMAAHWMAGREGYHQPTVVAQWSRPLCVVHGLDDPFISYDYLKQVQWGQLWTGQIIEMPGIGHAPFLENSTMFNAVLADFLGETYEP